MNYLAIIVAAILNMLIGYAWYSKILFAKQWMKAAGLTQNDIEKGKKTMGPKYGLMMAGSVVTAFVLAWFVQAVGAHSFMDGLKIGLLGWLGMTTTAQLSTSLFSNKPKELYFINTGYNLVSYCLMSGLLALWR
jgi:hypothetical protein